MLSLQSRRLGSQICDRAGWQLSASRSETNHATLFATALVVLTLLHTQRLFAPLHRGSVHFVRVHKCRFRQILTVSIPEILSRPAIAGKVELSLCPLVGRPVRRRMLRMLKRHEIEILLNARHPKTEVARLTGCLATPPK